jgi:hypothetical protein
MRRLIVALGSAAFLGLLSAPASAASASVGAAMPAPRPDAMAVTSGLAKTTLPEPAGIAYLSRNVNLQPTASGTWVNTPLQVTLPQPGTYILDANVHARIWGTPRFNVVIFGRLLDVTSGTVVPNSLRLLDHLVDANAGNAPRGQRVTAPISELITVTGPTTIRLQAARVNQIGASTRAEILAVGGFTSLRYARVSP